MKPIAPRKGIAYAFPDVCKTPSAPPPGSQIPIPYPNVAQLSDATGYAEKLRVGSDNLPVLLIKAEVTTSSGDEAGSIGGVQSGKTKGKCTITGGSSSVVYGLEEKKIVRFMDETEHNDGNAKGMVLSSFPTVMVGD